jgi:hypothetical protein
MWWVYLRIKKNNVIDGGTPWMISSMCLIDGWFCFDSVLNVGINSKPLILV